MVGSTHNGFESYDSACRRKVADLLFAAVFPRFGLLAGDRTRLHDGMPPRTFAAAQHRFGRAACLRIRILRQLDLMARTICESGGNRSFVCSAHVSRGTLFIVVTRRVKKIGNSLRGCCVGSLRVRVFGGNGVRRAAAAEDEGWDSWVLNLLAAQNSIILRNLPGVRQDVDPTHLHDVRVAFRRYRVLLRQVAREIPACEARQWLRSHSRRVGQLSRELGIRRDSHVWCAFLEDPRRGVLREGSSWRRYLAQCREAGHRLVPRFQAALTGPACEAVLREIRELLASRWTSVVGCCTPRSNKLFARRHLAMEVRDVLAHALPETDRDPDRLHALRRRCRRVRYLAEFFAHFLGKGGRELAESARQTASALGTHHDMDVHLAASAGKSMPPRVVMAAEKCRASAWRTYRKEWPRLVRLSQSFAG